LYYPSRTENLSITKTDDPSVKKVLRLENHSIYCRCHTADPDAASVLVLESVKRTEHGWKTRGHYFCPGCGEAVQRVRHEIELAASTFQCPKCKRVDSLEYEIDHVTKDNGKGKTGFSFSVIVNFSQCKNRKSIKKIIKSIFDVVKIKIGPDGVEIEKS